MYNLTVTRNIEQKNATFNATNIPTSANATHQYNIDWNVLSQGKKGVTLRLDTDGDGIFERCITCNSELTKDEPLLGTYTITTTPSGLQIEVDGVSYIAPCTFEWQIGSSHEVYVHSLKSGGMGIRYVWTS